MASTEPYEASFTACLLGASHDNQLQLLKDDNQLLKAENKRLLGRITKSTLDKSPKPKKKQKRRDIITKMDASIDTKHRPSPYAYPKELRNNVINKTNEGTYYMKYDKKYTRIYKSDVGYFYLEGWDVKHTNTIMADSINKLVKSIRNVKSVNAWTLIYDTNI